MLLASGLTTNEESVSGEHRPIIAILKQVTDAVLGMTRGMHRFDLDVLADRERLAVLRDFRDFVAVSTADDWDGKRFQLGTVVSKTGTWRRKVHVYHLCVASSVIVVTSINVSFSPEQRVFETTH